MPTDDKAPASTSPPGTPTGGTQQPAAQPAAPTPAPAAAKPAEPAKKEPETAPKHESVIKDPVTIDTVREGKVDPQGRVKQQDAVGNVLADERELREASARATPRAPAIQTSKSQFFTRKMAELENAAIEAENLQGTRRAQARAMLRAQLLELREQENRTVSGANIRTPRGNILHADEAQQHNPELHYRLVNINQPGKAENAKALGYTKVPESEGGKTLGDLALFSIPQERWAKMTAGKVQDTKDRIKKVTEDMKGEIREMSKFLRSRGVDIDERRLGITGEDE